MALPLDGTVAPQTGFGAPPTWKGTEAEWQQLTQNATADIQASIRQGLESSQGFGDFLLGALKTLGPVAALGILGPGMFAGAGSAGAGAGTAAGSAAGAATGAFELGGIAGGVSGAGGATGLGSAFGLGNAALGGTLAGSAGALSSGASGAAGVGASGSGIGAAAAEVIPSMTTIGSLPTAGGLTAGQTLAGAGLVGGTAAALGGGEAIPSMETVGQRPPVAPSVTGLSPEQLAAMAAGGSALASTVNLTSPTATQGGTSWLDRLLTPGGIAQAGTALAGGLLGGVGAANQPDSRTTTSQNQIDPRMASILYGSAGNNGLLNQLVTTGQRPQDAGLALAGQAGSNYVGQNSGYDLGQMRDAAGRLMAGNTAAPTMGAASMARNSMSMPADMQAAIAAMTPEMRAAQINAPSQNGTDLSSAYQQMIYGDNANNPYLTGAIQKGINQSNTAFGNMLTDQTKATQGLLGNIRGGAIAAGQYGGSRQGIAEGQALDSFNTNMSRAASQFGQNNTDAAVGAQAGAYDAGKNRALSAMSGLGAQQYGVATNDAQMRQQANQTNYQGALQTNLTNAGFQQQANQTNYAGGLTQGQANLNSANLAGQANAGFQQAANSNNLQSQLSTNSLNSANTQAGINATSGLLGSAYNMGQTNDAYDLNKLGRTTGLLAPFTGLNSSTSATQPLYNNTAGNIAGGVTTALGIYNAFK